ncbi:MAG: DJ-1/PfpI family protein [Sedimentisphaerales bacterium]|nr:DJ-1/PfpI family protein [Sedimentisphaerales bacterium]
MKRKMLFIIIIACFTAVSFGQRRARTSILKIIQLTKPVTSGTTSFEDALSKLRPAEKFTGQPVDNTIVGQLAWAGLGNRISSSAAQVIPQPLQSPFPMQIYMVINEGVFFYQPLNHSMERIVEGDIRLALAGATAMPTSVASAGCVIVVASTSVSRNTAARRGGTSASARNAMLLEAGHIAQNIQLQAVCLEGLGSTAISEFDSSAVSKVCNLQRDLDVLYIVCVGYMTEREKLANPSDTAAAKKAAIIVPAQNFEDEEFWQTKNMLDSARILVTVVSNQPGPIRGRNGTLFDVPVRADQIRADDFDALIVIGGPGTSIFNNDPVVRNLLRDASQKRKIIGASSYGTVILAGAGILQGVKVTGPVAESTNIQRMGAVFSNLPVEEHMRVITCAGPQAARIFATALADAILGR